LREFHRPMWEIGFCELAKLCELSWGDRSKLWLMLFLLLYPGSMWLNERMYLTVRNSLWSAYHQFPRRHNSETHTTQSWDTNNVYLMHS
jgi:hypothetical protein